MGTTPSLEALVVYLLDCYVPTGVATIDIGELQERTRNRSYQVRVVEGEIRVSLTDNSPGEDRC